MGFKDYKIRDGVHLPTDAYRKNYDSIFKKKKCKTHTKKKKTTMSVVTQKNKHI